MKAGIYKTYDGGLAYVRKDRTVSAVLGTSYPITVGAKVKAFEGGQWVIVDAGRAQYQLDRYADVPNGCTDHAGYLARVDEERKAVIEVPPRAAADELKGFEQGGVMAASLREGEVAGRANERKTGMSPVLGMSYGRTVAGRLHPGALRMGPRLPADDMDKILSETVTLPALLDADAAAEHALRVQKDCFLNAGAGMSEKTNAALLAVAEPVTKLYQGGELIGASDQPLDVRFPPTEQQEEIFEAIRRQGEMLLTMPVGAGKTAAMLGRVSLSAAPTPNDNLPRYAQPCRHKLYEPTPLPSENSPEDLRAQARYFNGPYKGKRLQFFERQLRRRGFRVVSAASARKHRKKGRRLIPLYNGRYAWLPREATCMKFDDGPLPFSGEPK